MPDSTRRHGALRERFHFQQRGTLDDGWSNPQPGAGPFETKFTVFAGLRPRTGGESVTAARLEGRQPFVVTVRFSAAMLDVTTAWQMVDARNENRILAIKSPPADPDGKRQWIEFLAQDGGGPS